jgi:hypothetical protein
MSWVRWGSRCYQGWPFRCSPCSVAPSACPGSSVYVYEAGYGDAFVCCGCSMAISEGDELTPNDVEGGRVTPEGEVVFGSRKAMRIHLAAHASRGDHVPMSLYDDAAMASDLEAQRREYERVFRPARPGARRGPPRR